jgi:hypothetical protein
MFRRLLAAALLSFAIPALATPHLHDGNDLWIDPDEQGWGLNLFHQGDTLFASLFVYGPDGTARWYTGSSLVGDDGGPLHDHPAVYNGALYESTGPAFGGAFDPSRVTRRQVGNMSVELGREKPSGTAPIRNYAYVSYDIDGVRVAKKVYPFSFVAMGLTGSYTGYARDLGNSVQLNFNVALSNGSFGMSTTSASASCSYSGRQEPNGSLFAVEGTYSCNDGRSGSFNMSDVDVTQHGFTAPTSFGIVSAQRTSSSIRGDGYRTDLWFNPQESGWGLNIVEQGDTLFGTLFVYDAQGRARWYSASNLTYEQCAPPDAASDCNGRYRGALVESTGPYFGTSFNPAAVTRRQVGTISLDTFGNNTAYADITIDGMTMTRKPLQRFAFRTNSLAGAYSGHILASNGNSDRGMQVGPVAMGISESGDTITIDMGGSKGNCRMIGKRVQYGRQIMASGPYDCGGAAFGQMSLMDVYVTADGFTGRVDFGTEPGVNVFYPIGRIEGTRVSSPVG